MVVTNATMVATEEHLLIRTMVATDGLIIGDNGAIIHSNHIVQVGGAIIQSNRWPISGGN